MPKTLTLLLSTHGESTDFAAGLHGLRRVTRTHTGAIEGGSSCVRFRSAIAIASIALAMRALRRAVKKTSPCRLHQRQLGITTDTPTRQTDLLTD